MSLINIFEKSQLKKDNPDVRPGDLVKVYQKNLDKEGGKPQIFEGAVLARKHGQGLSSTITVRKEIKGIGVERIFPLHSPLIEKIEIVKQGKVRRAKLYYLRTAKGKKKRIKSRNIENKAGVSPDQETPVEKIVEPEFASEENQKKEENQKGLDDAENTKDEKKEVAK